MYLLNGGFFQFHHGNPEFLVLQFLHLLLLQEREREKGLDNLKSNRKFAGRKTFINKRERERERDITSVKVNSRGTSVACCISLITPGDLKVVRIKQAFRSNCVRIN